jgi:hypothetical protein
MGVYHAENAARSRSILRTVFRQYPDYATYGDLPLLHNLTNLRYWAKKDSTGIIGEFDTQIEAIGNNLLQKDSNNPYANSYLGTYYNAKGDKLMAAKHFRAITNAKNFSKNWYTVQAEQWLKQQSGN